MKIKLFCSTDCDVVESWKVKKKSVAAETDFPCIYTILKSEGGEGRGVGGGYPSVAAYLRKISQVMVKW